GLFVSHDGDPGIELVDEQGAGPETFHHLHHLLVEAFENRSHPDDRSRSDQHTQYGQESPELVSPKRVQRQEEVFANGLASLGHAYASVRKASMGSRFAALLAG